MEDWEAPPASNPDRFTTVGRWRGPFGPLTIDGRSMGVKAHQFRRFVGLPGRIAQTLEIALDIDPSDAADRRSLEANGWHLADPLEAAGDPWRFRDYVIGSGGEFSVAQGVYVDTACGWVSDRTVRYLAAGRPALVQETGFSRNYPTGVGLVPFTTFDDAVAGAEAIRRDFASHAVAARQLAAAYFDSDVVLARFLEQVDLAP